MLPRSIWIIVSLLAVATVTNSYSHRTYGSPSPPTTPPPQNGRDWDMSDAKKAWDQEGRIVTPDDYQPFQSQGRNEDSEPTHDVAGLRGAPRDLVNDRTPVSFIPNPNQGYQQEGNFNPGPYNSDYPQPYNRPPQFNQARPSSFNSDTPGHNNNVQFFKVQRKPDGKLNVVFNDTAIPPYRKDGPGMPNQVGLNAPARDIVFPEEQSGSLLPRCTETGSLLCTQVENYPTNIVAQAIHSQSLEYQELFVDDLLPENVDSLNITQRIDAPGEESLCFSRERIIYPQAGMTKDNNWSFIVNQPNYTQGVRIEECSNPGSACQMADNFPLNYVTECRQKYIIRQLVSINSQGLVAKDLFQIPSCCKCILKNRSF